MSRGFRRRDSNRFVEGPETTHFIVRWRRVASTAYRASQVSEAAAKEFNIEQTLDNMLSDWTGLELQIFPYRDTGTGVLKGVDEVQAILDEHVTMTQVRPRRPVVLWCFHFDDVTRI